MVDLVIELTLIVAVLLPLIATSLQPVRAVSRSGSGRLFRFRRSS
ncbi:MAG: hypothetical protein ABSB50_13995 [Terracidiphilus sp.]|jgi:hypothetical protein